MLTSNAQYRQILRLSLLLIILYGQGHWATRLPTTAVAVGMLARPQWLRDRFGWGLLFVLVAEGLGVRWYRSDNHQFLIAYWLLAINLSLYSNSPRESLRRIAKPLVACVFLFATAWKLVGREFLDGTFWEGMLLTDARFAFPAGLLGGLDGSAIAVNRRALSAFMNPGSALDAVALLSSPSLDTLSVALGWGSVALEGVIALLFVLPESMVRRPLGLTGMLLFLLAYVWVPVPGFGWVLTIMTLSYTKADQRWWQGVFFLALLGLVLVAVPKEQLFMVE